MNAEIKENNLVNFYAWFARKILIHFSHQFFSQIFLTFFLQEKGAIWEKFHIFIEMNILSLSIILLIANEIHYAFIQKQKNILVNLHSWANIYNLFSKLYRIVKYKINIWICPLNGNDYYYFLKHDRSFSKLLCSKFWWIWAINKETNKKLNHIYDKFPFINTAISYKLLYLDA